MTSLGIKFLPDPAPPKLAPLPEKYGDKMLCENALTDGIEWMRWAAEMELWGANVAIQMYKKTNEEVWKKLAEELCLQAQEATKMRNQKIEELKNKNNLLR